MRLQDRPPWIIRTYAGFADAEASNARFRSNLEKGQRGLSVAFDLPTQNGYDSDHAMAAGEVGGTGVAVCSIADMALLFDGIDLGAINTSMTINATAPWLFALYLAVAEQRGIPWDKLRGTTQNDLMKEFVARGTHIFEPQTSLRLETDLIAFATRHAPQWNPMNACGYHYMESGAGPAQEIGMAFGNAILVLDELRPHLTDTEFAETVRRMSFFINSGIELVAEIAKVRAYSRLWPKLCRELWGIDGVAFRAGCQVRSLTLTAQQPEVNIVRIAYEALPVVLSASARVGALQLPGFREALSLPDEAEQVYALRTQQVLMYETDVADYGDIFEGSIVIEKKTAELEAEAQRIALDLRGLGYAAAITRVSEELTAGLLRERRAVDTGERVRVGVNAFTEARPFAEPGGGQAAAQDPEALRRHLIRLRNHRAFRDQGAVASAMLELRRAFDAGENILPASIALAKAGGTTGEWTQTLEDATLGRYSPPLGIDGAETRAAALTVPASPHPYRLVLGKSGLDGHVNAVKLIAVACARSGFEVIYTGIKQSPEALVRAAIQEDADLLGISSLSGAHLHIAAEVMRLLREQNATDIKVIIGGILPEKDLPALRDLGIAATFTPDSHTLGEVVESLIALCQ
ncbi:MAG: protein meaA [Myxococcales bacterium]|nr:protein meaA [Myxococcales bacterium]